MADRPVRVAVVGLGEMGRAHLAAHLENRDCEVVALADTAPDRARRLADEHGVASWHQDPQDVLRRPDIDVVDIVLPHNLHAGFSLAALASGKHVICEKPGALRPSEIEEAMGAATRSGKGYVVKYYMRHSEVHQRVARLIAEGAIGHPTLARAFFASNRLDLINDPSNWRANPAAAGGGVLLDVGVHTIDLLHDLFGQASSVSARCCRTRANTLGAVEDLASCRLEFAGGVLAEVTCLWSDTSLPFRWSRQFHGTDGSIEVTEVPGRQVIRVASRGEFRHEEVLTQSWSEINRAALRSAVAVVSSPEPEASRSPHAALRTLRSALAAYESDRTCASVSPEAAPA